MPGSSTRYILSSLYYHTQVQPLEITINLKQKRKTLKSKKSIWNTQWNQNKGRVETTHWIKIQRSKTVSPLINTSSDVQKSKTCKSTRQCSWRGFLAWRHSRAYLFQCIVRNNQQTRGNVSVEEFAWFAKPERTFSSTFLHSLSSPFLYRFSIPKTLKHSQKSRSFSTFPFSLHFNPLFHIDLKFRAPISSFSLQTTLNNSIRLNKKGNIEWLVHVFLCIYIYICIYTHMYTYICIWCKEELTYVPGKGVILFHLPFPYDIPNAGHPVSKQGKHGHEKCENNCAVLGVTIQLLKETQEA